MFSSVGDFIHGRVARKIRARHYLSVAGQASKFYPRYAEYAKSLRDRAGLMMDLKPSA